MAIHSRSNDAFGCSRSLATPAEIHRLLATLFDKLNRGGKWAPIYTSKENAIKGISTHEAGAAKTVLEGAIEDRYLNLKPTNYGDQVSLNFKKKDEIRAMIDELLDDR